VLGLTESAHPAPSASASHSASSPAPDTIERDIIDTLKSLSRRPINPSPNSELMADLGFDSLQVLELVGELEDRVGIAVPLNSLTHIRTVSQIDAEIRRLLREQAPQA
jgi:acyl carrier protein